VDDMLFRELLLSAGQALDHARGKRELRTTVLPPPPKPMSADEVRHLRGALNVSQAWESKRRRPEGPALLLLRLLERQGALAFAYAKSSPSKARKVAEAVQRPGKRARRRAAPRR
jgi:DNA-binding transcriptional regulator YiaG